MNEKCSIQDDQINKIVNIFIIIIKVTNNLFHIQSYHYINFNRKSEKQSFQNDCTLWQSITDDIKTPHSCYKKKILSQYT